MKNKNVEIRYQELPSLGVFLEAGFLRDKELFAAFFPLYVNGFDEEFLNNRYQPLQQVIN